MEPEVFLDTAYAVALAAPSDQHHGVAATLANQIVREQVRIVTTREVVIEIGNALSRLPHRGTAIRLIDSLDCDPAVTVVPINDSLYFEARELYRNRPDKEWGMTDCISFVLMRSKGIVSALTSDVHFEQAGFRALLREGSIAK